MTQLPRVGTASVEHQGLAILKEIVMTARPNGLGFLFRELPQLDYGIDAQIEVVDGVGSDAVATGKFVSVQVKSGRSYFQNESEQGWVNYVGKSTVEYWRGHSVPVLFVLVDIEKREAFWTQGDSEKHQATDQNFKILVPKEQRLGSGSEWELRLLAENTSEEERQLALLDSMVPLMHAAQQGEHLCMELTRWYNKSSRRIDFWLGISGSRPTGTDGPSDMISFSSGSILQGGGLISAAGLVAPWADASPDDDFEDYQRSFLFDEYLAECGTYDSETGGMIDSVGNFPHWLKKRRTDPNDGVVAYSDNGEYASYRIALTLNKLGSAFLLVKSHLLGTDGLTKWPPD